ncbi:hypothetical protein C5S39_13630 [Candidatus Methanophagaceae archaeon]|jgi:hypothetical protein|nr:hypothetical protein C5S39_13630 [Methanophagales archaeon]
MKRGERNKNEGGFVEEAKVIRKRRCEYGNR